MNNTAIDLLIQLTDRLLNEPGLSDVEIQVLRQWPVRNLASVDPFVVEAVIRKASSFIKQAVDDEDAAEDLVTLIRRIGGEQPAVTSLRRTSQNSLCKPRPQIVFSDHLFVFSGRFNDSKTRQDCFDMTTALNGRVADSVTKRVNYVVVGNYITGNSSHRTYGRKIEAAMKYRAEGMPLHIISESHWLSAARWLGKGLPLVDRNAA